MPLPVSIPSGGILLFLRVAGRLTASWFVSDCAGGHGCKPPLLRGRHARLLQTDRNPCQTLTDEFYHFSLERSKPFTAVQPGCTSVAPGGSPAPPNIWQIDLGGQHEFQLLLRREGRPPPQAWLHQVGNYTISEQGLELAAELHLDCHQEPLVQVAMQVDSPLRLTKARYGEQPLSWTSSRDDDQSDSLVVLTFPQPIQGRNRVVHLSALAPLPEAASWPLPRIRPQQIRWQQEAAWLKFTPPLVLSQLKVQRARQFRPSGDQVAQERLARVGTRTG